MGLARPALRLIAREHKRKPFAGAVLTLGRQNVYATPEEIRRILLSEQIQPAELPPELNLRTNIPAWTGTPRERCASDTAFFKLLSGAETSVSALDRSTAENPDIVHDLNLPAPDELKNRFDLIVDSGTLEHVFDVKTALSNIAVMLKTGGRALHISPANQYVNHGFYQFSPILFFDYYKANAFLDLRGCVCDHSTHFPESLPWDIFETAPSTGRIASERLTRSLAVIFIAEKGAGSTSDRAPVQSFYQPYQPATAAQDGSLLKASLKRLLPDAVRGALRRNVPGLNLLKKPWGLKRRERLS